MIKATISGGDIHITADADSAAQVKEIQGATRTKKMPAFTWTLPFNLDNVAQLRSAGVLASPGLVQAIKDARRTAQYVERTKVSEDATPIAGIPIKPDVTMYKHQVRAFNIALAHFGYWSHSNLMPGGAVAYFMDMGSGKTMTTVAVAGRLFLDGQIKRMLVVAPSSVCAVWPSEFRKFAGFPARVGVLLGDRDKRISTLRYLTAPALPGTGDPLRVAVINYESTWRLEEELAKFKADMIVCDESQRIKSATAQQSKAMHRLGAGVPYKMILTGTPIQNDTRDLWSQYRFLSPGVFCPSYYNFLKRYAVMGGVGNHQYLGPRNLEELTRKAHSIAYRVTKAECLDLPEKMFEDRAVELEDDAKKLYRRIQRESFAALEGGEQVTANNVLTRLLRLQQITGGFISDDDGELRSVSTAKLDALEDIVQSCCVDEGNKLVIFARFRAELAAIRERVAKVLGKNLKQVAIWGDIPIPQRGAIVDQFQTDPQTRVFVGQIDASAEGITLNSATTTVYYSTTWNLAKYQQSQDRTHRIGVRSNCLYIHLVVPGSIDHKIMAALKKKEDLAKSVVDNWKTLLSDDTDEGGIVA